MFNKIRLWKKKPVSSNLQDRISALKMRQIPEHVAIIMDGNGRWAKKRTLPRIAGHHEGMKCVKRITTSANDLGIKVLTLYAFSTENWKRPKSEVDYIMSLPEQFLGTFLPELIEKNVRVTAIGYTEGLPESTLNSLNHAVEQTKYNTGLQLNFALNYGSRAEIIDAVKNVVKDSETGKIEIDNFSEEMFSTYLMTGKIIEPDLLIRTSGEVRISNFMLWQIAYSELYFTDVLWPDFSELHLIEAIEEFQNRQRRFGGV
ncbi:isoprenyl transferase [Cytobacillus oceanisediminis]|jgi:undecaprenyl diphosphate synthase|uniref:Isoprenyl transferase n=2 Tax=Niallia TaxID=2837506 RepID=A0A941GEN6_NIACI|nr:MULTISPECIES: isoprenyl transferase [Bacillaceae]EOR26449.1 undecaprenyl pyrophosphate synthase [Niallia nealsonii AAU1]MBQ6446263.1 isoprenyl transferase [Bacillus sp. (in: firmicutes)]MDU1845028.1 isoprenyl transferase [Niallia nealsonii]MBZ9532678.1 isoprenyl transferase [Cytobacillus oceanisediminis]MCB5235394.1 isoprenyl transferase [Niallia circulans]